MRRRLFLTYLAVLAPTWAMLEYGWWYAFEFDRFHNYFLIPSLRIIPFVLAAIVTLVIWAIWHVEIRAKENQTQAIDLANANENIEKRKRERIDTVLRDLSDEDLLRLRQRLLDGTISDEHLEDALVGDDNVLLYQEKRR